MFYWLMKRVIAGPWLRLYFRPWTRGRENVPQAGGVILASNHLAVIDSFILPLVLEREIVFIGKSEYFTGKGLKGKLQAGFFRGVGTIPVDRSGGRASEAALRTGLRRLEDGGLFGIYPEGTRSPDGRLYRGKTGVARLAIESGAPVVPVAMVKTNIAQPLGSVIPRPIKIGIVFGEPLEFSRFQGQEEDRAVLRAVADEIMGAIQKISGQEYVDIYAATQKARLAAGQAPHPALADGPGSLTPPAEPPVVPRNETDPTEPGAAAQPL